MGIYWGFMNPRGCLMEYFSWGVNFDFMGVFQMGVMVYIANNNGAIYPPVSSNVTCWEIPEPNGAQLICLNMFNWLGKSSNKPCGIVASHVLINNGQSTVLILLTRGDASHVSHLDLSGC